MSWGVIAKEMYEQSLWAVFFRWIHYFGRPIGITTVTSPNQQVRLRTDQFECIGALPVDVAISTFFEIKLFCFTNIQKIFRTPFIWRWRWFDGTYTNEPIRKMRKFQQINTSIPFFWPHKMVQLCNNHLKSTMIASTLRYMFCFAFSIIFKWFNGFTNNEQSKSSMESLKSAC